MSAITTALTASPWPLLILALALVVLGAVRFDVLRERWRELTRPQGLPPAESPLARAPAADEPLPPASARPAKPELHRSGHRH